LYQDFLETPIAESLKLVNSENREPLSDRFAEGRRPSSELWEPWEIADETTQPLVDRVHSAEQGGLQDDQTSPRHVEEPFVGTPAAALDPQFSYREHVTGSLAAHLAEAPLFQPAYLPPPPQMYPQQAQAYAPQTVYQQYPGYPAGYAPYAYSPYAWQPQPPHPKRDGYLLAMAISSLVGSSLVLLIGLIFTGLLLLATALPNKTMNASQLFNVDIVITLFICVGIIGGSFGLYHSIRSLIKKPSADFSLPWFWIFLVLYIAVAVIGFVLHSRGQEVAFPVLSVTLIVLAAVLPALAVTAIAVRRLRTRGVKDKWETSWRRFTLALLSGATLSVTLAGVLEFVLLVVLILLTHTQGMQNLVSCVNTPNVQNCQNTGAYSLLFITIAVVAPLVEETVKPLAVVLLIGRVRSAAEAFVLGLACGIGFDIVETSLYISSGYHDWLNVALTRTGAGLLHGFGAAMVALGWYYLTHAKESGHRKAFLRAFACWFYAVFQHAVWNGSVTLVLLPGPVGQFLQNWTLNLGIASLPSDVVINSIETLFILAFFIYMTGKLRSKPASPSVPLQATEGGKEILSKPSEAMASA
jgi:RsiW-degrading membrane proteinase PrsW (M82 family)